MKSQSLLSIAAVTGLFVVSNLTLIPPSVGQAQAGSRTFPETGHTVRGAFLAYWDGHGGLAQQGYPLSEEMPERSPLNGQSYTVQYFERAVFERHPENAPPFDILLSQLGAFRYKEKYPAGAPNQHASTQQARAFPETGHSVGGVFRTYWESHGGLAQQGYPLSEEFTEVSDLDHKPYTVQYFERAVFEYHPENRPPYDVLLSQLGTFRYQGQYGGPAPTPVAAVTPASVAVREFDFDFAPAALTIPTGTTVTWTNEGPTIHTVGQKGGNWSSDVLQKGQSFSHQFSTPGTYTIYCTIHPLMQMTITVR